MAVIRISYLKIVSKLKRILTSRGFSKERAGLCAKLFAKASLDGVASHGLNRFSQFLEYVDQGLIDVSASPVMEFGNPVFERWNGYLGPGNLNAHFAMNRAIELAREKGMGLVTMHNTNHWMRGGNYGWQAVEQDCLCYCATNTKPNMPAWGASEPVLGNNPIVLGAPREQGGIVLDMALAQFSYGKMEEYLRERQLLPYEGGFDDKGKLTRNPQDIVENEMALPIGLWKGAGLSLMMDIFASILSAGEATHQIGKKVEEHGISQFFLCLYPPKLGAGNDFKDHIESIIEDLKSVKSFDGRRVRYPGEKTLEVRAENREKGVPVDEEIWNQILAFEKS